MSIYYPLLCPSVLEYLCKYFSKVFDNASAVELIYTTVHNLSALYIQEETYGLKSLNNNPFQTTRHIVPHFSKILTIPFKITNPAQSDTGQAVLFFMNVFNIFHELNISEASFLVFICFLRNFSGPLSTRRIPTSFPIIKLVKCIFKLSAHPKTSNVIEQCRWVWY